MPLIHQTGNGHRLGKKLALRHGVDGFADVVESIG